MAAYPYPPGDDPAPVAVVIEDEPQIRRFVRGALEGEGWLVHEADTLQRGLVEAGTRKPDLLVLDLGLPDGDGLDLIRDVRGWSAVPIIVLSARVGEDDKIAAFADYQFFVHCWYKFKYEGAGDGYGSDDWYSDAIVRWAPLPDFREAINRPAA